MKKITKEAVEAFVKGMYYKKDNTEIKKINKTTFGFFLFGNRIATLDKKYLYLYHCEYLTRTTKERLNGILNYFGLNRIYQKNFIWYIGDEKFDTVLMFKRKDIKDESIG